MSWRAWCTALAGLCLALIGMWGPWIPHRAASLVLSGWDLAEFAKFVVGASTIRELFYLPVWSAGMALTLLAIVPIHHHGGGPIRRLGLIVLALGLLSALLPPYPDLLTGYRSPAFRWQFILGVGGAATALAVSLLAAGRNGFAARLPLQWIGVLFLVLALIGALPALWQFLGIRGAIEELYDAQIGWGWGLTAFLAGWSILAVTGGVLFIQRSKQ